MPAGLIECEVTGISEDSYESQCTAAEKNKTKLRLAPLSQPSNARGTKDLNTKRFLIWGVSVGVHFLHLFLDDLKKNSYFWNGIVDQGCVIHLWDCLSLPKYWGKCTVFTSCCSGGPGSETFITDAPCIASRGSHSACSFWQCFIHLSVAKWKLFFGC